MVIFRVVEDERIEGVGSGVFEKSRLDLYVFNGSFLVGINFPLRDIFFFTAYETASINANSIILRDIKQFTISLKNKL